MLQLNLKNGFSLVIVIFLPLLVKSIPDYSDLPPGPYCAQRFDGCCPGRSDECSYPIAGTLCYCDEFCDRIRSEDCCPDFWQFCRGIAPDPEPTGRCFYNGIYFNKGSSIKQNCNQCTCSSSNNGTKLDVLCETNECLIDEDLLEEIKEISPQLGWYPTNYSEFYGHTLQEGLTFRLGTLQPHRAVMRMNNLIKFYEPSKLPQYFDSNEKWPNLISSIQDQGWCGSSWAMSTASVATDRFSIMSNGRESKLLSAQYLLSCNHHRQRSCEGGHLDRAWLFFRRYGIVDDECYPYAAATKKCPFSKKGTLQSARCIPPPGTGRTSYYKVGPVYKLGNETDIMNEILNNGPVQATMKVYQDLFLYRSGVYKHSPMALVHRTGYHSVKIVGWGVDNTENPPVKYWKVANSWGRGWGEEGYFRIRRGENECEIESFVLGTWAEFSKIPENNVILPN